MVLDPTLLLTADQWDSMADHPANYPKGGYILCYCISRPGALTPYLERLHQETGLPVVQLCGIRQKVHPKAKQILDAGPAEFLGLFQNAAYVVTNSFHGTVFSVQFHRPFFTTVSPGGAVRPGTVPDGEHPEPVGSCQPGHRQGGYGGAAGPR